MKTIPVAFRGALALGALCVGAFAYALDMRFAQIAPTETVCARPLPSGWIKIDDAWNPTSCGNPSHTTYNVWIIQQYSDLAVGAVMSACTGPAQPGWIVVDTRWNPTACGHPTNNQANMMTIQRLN